jgi:hypothetical protein
LPSEGQVQKNKTFKIYKPNPKTNPMKTIKTLKQNLLKSALFILLSTITIIAGARSASSGIAPAKPASFIAVLNINNNNRVDLKWSTETETNLSHFIVERSVDGINFSDAALVFAYGNTTSKSDYVFADNIIKVQSDIIYYRITSIGADGKTQQSDIQVIHTGK